MSYLIGSLATALLGLLFGVIEVIKEGDRLSVLDVIAGLKAAFIGGLCCGGPLVLLPCAVLVTGGVSKYKQLIGVLRSQDRVCDTCGAVALFDDEYVDVSWSKGQTAEELIPHMNVFEEDGKTRVLCDACLEEDCAAHTA
ncbi:MAG: hypothetical protein AAF085_00385 [Planctomycetota bacterium]